MTPPAALPQSPCQHCKDGYFEGTDVECVNGVLIDIDVANEGWQSDVIYPLAPCHPEYLKPEEDQVNDSQERLENWSSLASEPTALPQGETLSDEAMVEVMIAAWYNAEHWHKNEGIKSDMARVLAAITPAIERRGIERAAELVEPLGVRPCDCTSCYCGNVDDAQAVAVWDAMSFNAKAVLSMARSDAPRAQAWQPTHRHVKRGTEYEVVGNAILQTNHDLADEEALIVYRGEDGKLWARPPSEFNDGRFVALDHSGSTP